MRGAHDQIEELIERKIDSSLFPGAVWLVERRGQIVSEGSLGHASIIPDKRPMSRDTIFDLASVTKPVCTGTLLLEMWEKGQIDIEDPVNAYVPAFSGGWKDEVHISHLLSHSSGIKPISFRDTCDDRSEVLDHICSAERAYEPGTKVAYIDLEFVFLGKILESIRQRPLDELAEEEVFAPLGMTNTMFRPPRGMRDRIAATQNSPDRRKVLVGEVHDGDAHFLGGVSGHAGLFSCVGDLARFCRMMLGHGPDLLSRETIEEATRIWSDDGVRAYGLSWLKRKGPIDPAGSAFSPKAYGHTGYTGTSVWLDPDKEMFAILLTNRVHPDRNADRIPEMNATRARFHELASGS